MGCLQLTYHFEFNLHYTCVGSWLSPTPYQQHHSPYMAMSNNPLSFIDPDGGKDNWIEGGGGGSGGDPDPYNGEGLLGAQAEQKAKYGGGGGFGLSASFGNYSDFNSNHLGYQSEMAYYTYRNQMADPRDFGSNSNLAYQNGQVGRIVERLIGVEARPGNLLTPTYSYEFVPLALSSIGAVLQTSFITGLSETHWRGLNGKWNSLGWGGNGRTGARSFSISRSSSILGYAKGISSVGTGLSVVSTGVDIVDYSNGKITGPRLSYRVIGNAAAIGSAVVGTAGLGALVGGAFYFAEKAYDSWVNDVLPAIQNSIPTAGGLKFPHR